MARQIQQPDRSAGSLRGPLTPAPPASVIPPAQQASSWEEEDPAIVARAQHDARHHPDPEMRSAVAALLSEAPDDAPIVEVGPGPYRAPEVAQHLAAVLVAYRRTHGITQEELGRRLEWRQPQVSRAEAARDTPELETLGRVARNLGVVLTLRVTPAGMTLEVEETSR